MIKDLGNGIKLECPEGSQVLLGVKFDKGMQVEMVGDTFDLAIMLTILLEKFLKDVPEEVLRAGLVYSMMACLRNSGALGDKTEVSVDYKGSGNIADLIKFLVKNLEKIGR